MINPFRAAYAAWQNLKDLGDPFDIDLDFAQDEEHDRD